MIGFNISSKTSSGICILMQSSLRRRLAVAGRMSFLSATWKGFVHHDDGHDSVGPLGGDGLLVRALQVHQQLLHLSTCQCTFKRNVT